MRRTCLVLAALLLGGCPGGNRSIGESCSSVSDCEGGLQCLDHTCVPQCQRHSDCGDGFQCNSGQCVAATGAIGERCQREVDCAPGLACHLDAAATGGVVDATCQLDHEGAVLDAPCAADGDCRDGTCALGRCVDLCAIDTDCPNDHVCSSIPRVEAASATDVPMFHGCLPASGTISWALPVGAPLDTVWLPVPGAARSIAVVMTVADPSQLVGTSHVVDPRGTVVYDLPSFPISTDQYYANALRHAPAPGLSVIQMPESPALPLLEGGYHMTIGSFRANGQPASDTPRATVIAKLDNGTILDVHFYFLDLADHPCAAAFDGGQLDATSAKTSTAFQSQYLATLRTIFGRAGIALGSFTYDDLTGHPDLDGLDAADLGALLSLSTHTGGVNIFFVRTLSPAGMLALVGGTPGAPRLAGTSASGAAVSIDSLCYQDWPTLARITAHAIARHMGLFRNKEPDGHLDPIPDSDDSTANLLYYSEYGGTDLSPGQQAILQTSPVLR